MISFEPKQDLFEEIERFDQCLCSGTKDEYTSLRKKLNQLRTLFEEYKMEGRLENDQVCEAEQKLEHFKQSLLNLNQSQNNSSLNGYLFPAKEKLTRFFSSLTSQPSGQMDRAQTASQMKKELLFSSRKETDLRHRKNAGGTQHEDSLVHHQDQHEKLASDMITLTKTLKHNIAASGKIIKNDINVLQNSAKKTESNLSNLKTESTRLDVHMNKGSCWLWVSLCVVTITFIVMILFIRFFPKSR